MSDELVVVRRADLDALIERWSALGVDAMSEAHAHRDRDRADEASAAAARASSLYDAVCDLRALLATASPVVDAGVISSSQTDDSVMRAIWRAWKPRPDDTRRLLLAEEGEG
jgi:hypothetical protein